MNHTRKSSGVLIATALWILTSPLGAQTGTWSNLAPLPIATTEFGVAAIDGRIYGAGNFDVSNSDRLLIYDVATDSWSQGPDMLQGNHHAGVAAVGGRLFVIGGTDTESLVQIFNPESGDWTQGQSMPTSRTAPAVVVLDEKIHVLGGAGSINQSDGKTTHEVYDPATDSWESQAPLLEPTEHVGGAAVGKKIYVVGGRLNLANIVTTQIYDSASDTWSLGANLPMGASGAAVVAFRNQIYVFGGEDIPRSEVSAAVQRYDPTIDAWTLLEDMPLALHGVPGTTIGDSIYIVGGGPIASSGSATTGLMRLKFPSARPAAPSKLKARVLSSNRVRLRWKDNSDGETSFIIQMKIAGSRFRKVATVAADVKRMVISGLEAGTTYTFRVRRKRAVRSPDSRIASRSRPNLRIVKTVATTAIARTTSGCIQSKNPCSRIQSSLTNLER